MEFVSTRDGSICASAAQAIVQGLSKDGGLFVPREIPKVSLRFIDELRALGYAGRALRVLAPWLTEFSEAELGQILETAYANFDVPEVAPVKKIKNCVYALELWHGPTLAFKDMALQLMPHLLRASAKKVGESREILILVATSGDTGKAALEGFAGVPGTQVCVFYPEQGVSEAQRLQMVTQEGDNVRVIAVKGNFDDAQTGIKRIFGDAEFEAALNARGIVLSSANSINLGRLLPQVVYYFSAYADLLGQGALKLGEPMDVAVPTGNFGNILAASYARDMGLPIGELICASNANNVLSEFIKTGVYNKSRPFHLTTSPSMDILVSSNLERLLAKLVGPEAVVGLMQQLKDEGRYALGGEALRKLRAQISGGWSDEAQVRHRIKVTFEQDHYLIDPHTAVALDVLERHREESGIDRPALLVSTASPYKFGRSVLTALTGNDLPVHGAMVDDFACCDRLQELSGLKLPQAISELPRKPILHSATCSPEQMKQALAQAIIG